MENLMVFISRQILIEWPYHRGFNDGGGEGRVGCMGITEVHTGLWMENQ